MSELPLTVDLAGDAFVFPAARSAPAVPARAPLPRPGAEGAPHPGAGRWLLRLVGLQIAASACLTTFVAYAMAPALARLPEPSDYGLRLGGTPALPASVQDGFHLRLSRDEAGE